MKKVVCWVVTAILIYKLAEFLLALILVMLMI